MPLTRLGVVRLSAPLAGWRRDRFGERAELAAGGLDAFEDDEQVFQRTRQPIELPHDEGCRLRETDRAACAVRAGVEKRGEPPEPTAACGRSATLSSLKDIIIWSVIS